MMSSTAKQIINTNGEVDWSLLNCVVKQQISLSPIERCSLANCLLQNLNANYFPGKEEERQFDLYFLQNDADLLIVLCNNLSQIQESCFRRDKIASLIKRFFFEDGNLENLLLKCCECGQVNSDSDQKLLTTIVSLPNLIANSFKLSVSNEFLPTTYFNRICEAIFAILMKVYQKQKKEISCSLEFISQLIGRLCFNNYGEIVWSSIFSQLIIKSGSENKDFLWRRIGYRLIIPTQQPRYIENIVKTIICFADKPQDVICLLENSVVSHAKVKFLLTNKFLLINTFTNDHVIRNIFGYLKSISNEVFKEAFGNVLSEWSRNSALKHRTYQQHFYLSRCLMFAAKHLKDTDVSENEKQEYHKLLMQGIESHLSSSQQDFRGIGMLIGETLTKIIEPNGPKLNFNYEKTADIEHLLRLLNEDVHKASENLASENKIEKVSDEKVEILEKTEIEEVTSDDDLPAFDMSHDIPLELSKKPVYLRDCLNGLIECKDTSWTEQCLHSAESIIRKNSSIVGDVAVEFTNVLLHLDDKFSLTDFIGWRMRGLVALCVCAPQKCAEFLTKAFYDRNCTMRQRLDILEVLVASSQELSSGKSPTFSLENNITDAFNQLTLSNPETKLAEEKWQDVVKRRVESKTRIISKSKKPKESKVFVNKFAPVAGYFFFPLMSNYDGSEITFDLRGDDDHFLLGRLLYSLGLLVHSAALAPVSKQMTKALIDFTWVFRYHSQS